MTSTMIFLMNTICLSLLFAGTTWAVIKYFKIDNAAARTGLWTAAFFLSVLSPLATFAPGGATLSVLQTIQPQAPATIETMAPVQATTGSVAPTTLSPPIPPANSVNLTKTLFIAAIIIWLSGTAWRTMLLVRDAFAIARVRWESSPTKASDQMARLPKNISLRTHPDLSVPIASGLFRPAIILPAAALTKLDGAVTQSAIAHELAHIKRGDLFFSFAEALTLCVFWWNPILWKIRTRIIKNREMACDDSAIASEGNPELYARSLVDYAERAIKNRDGATHHAALAATGSPSDLKQRVTRLMSQDYTSTKKLPVTRILLAGAAMTTVTICAAAAAPRIAIDYVGVTQSVSETQAPAKTDAENLGRSLVAAIADENWNAADALIDAGADINAVLYGDGTPLIAAVNVGSTNYVNKLIGLGADVDLAALYDETPLISAVRSRDLDIVRLLISAGADVNLAATTETGAIRSPLGEAERLGLTSIARALRDAGAA